MRTGLIRKTSQEARILALLESRGSNWTAAQELSAISLQYAARVHCMRRRGILIENKVEILDGRRRGFYRLVPKEKQWTLFPRAELSGHWKDPEKNC